MLRVPKNLLRVLSETCCGCCLPWTFCGYPESRCCGIHKIRCGCVRNLVWLTSENHSGYPGNSLRYIPQRPAAAPSSGSENLLHVPEWPTASAPSNPSRIQSESYLQTLSRNSSQVPCEIRCKKLPEVQCWYSRDPETNVHGCPLLDIEEKKLGREKIKQVH